MATRTEADVARLFHTHSSHERTRVIAPLIDLDRQPCRFRVYPGAPRTPLPGRDFAIDMPLGDALERRRSIRNYALREMPLETLGRLFHASYGLRVARTDGGEDDFRRPAPSAGGRYPLELYVAAQAVEGLGDGIYHYDARAHALEHVRPGLAQPALVDLLMDQEVARRANAVVVITAVRERTMWKYGQRGYRHVLLDAGHVGQNLYLVSIALGLGPTAIGGFYDQELGALLRLPEDEEPFYVVCIGQPVAEEARP
jgi:SagB-type dehydrogenase family enzyme